ncbi:hypothetical protein L9F63_009464 [Diploptera punctata]|uniref:Uncharacterized protein n=1 Tax=Diploptera punctata TaxID=6984 RepID=A0AAD8ESA2_DIPPU|nr:hypothetical protein L9F63_009464 [Diploptera punctata]
MTIDLYYSVGSPPCRSVLLLAKALGVKLNLKETSARNGETKTPQFLKINPQHCIPTLVDNGFVLWESRAILGYLANKYAKDDSIYPKDPQKRAIVDQRLYFDLGTFTPSLREFVLKMRSGKDPTADMATNIEEAFQLLDKFLDGQDWVAGNNITIADYSIVIGASLTELIGFNIVKYNNVTRWLERAKKTIEGYDEVLIAGNAVLKSSIPTK